MSSRCSIGLWHVRERKLESREHCLRASVEVQKPQLLLYLLQSRRGCLGGVNSMNNLISNSRDWQTNRTRSYLQWSRVQRVAAPEDEHGRQSPLA